MTNLQHYKSTYLRLCIKCTLRLVAELWIKLVKLFQNAPNLSQCVCPASLLPAYSGFFVKRCYLLFNLALLLVKLAFLENFTFRINFESLSNSFSKNYP